MTRHASDLCRYWIAAAGRYCHTTTGVRLYLFGPRCPQHAPGHPRRTAGRLMTTDRPANPAAAVRAARGWPMCAAGCGWPVDPAARSDRHPTCQPNPQEEPVSELLAPALRYAAQGWPVFMLARSKRPVANCRPCADPDNSHDPAACDCLICHGFYAATTDPLRVAGIVAAVPSGQLAVRTGAASGLVVVDVDPRHGGDDTMTALIRAGLLPPTAHVVTGSGGRHMYYRHPGRPVRCSQGKPGVGLGPGIDVKADGGYVVLPPSVHPRTGRPYWWVPGRQVEEMPPALVEACDPPPPAPAPTAPAGPISTRAAGGISHPDRLLAAHLHAVTSAPEGSRRTTLYGAARGVARMVAAHAIDPADAVAALTDAGRQAEQTDRDIRAAIRGGFHAEGVAA